MIAEAGTWRQQRRLQERRRSAARRKGHETLRGELAPRGSLPAALAPPPVAQDRASHEQPQEPPREQASPARPRVLVVPNAIAGQAPVVRKPGPTFADVLRTFDAPYRRRYADELTEQQDKVLREMLACYTPLLGTHRWTCGDCGTVVELPNGCNNRHCCTCGQAKRRRWAEDTCAQILPVEYCHIILTVPREITQLAMTSQHVLYSMMLREGAYAVLDGGRKLFRVELALLSLLHTWGQLLNAHLHSHSLLPLGGLRVGALEWMDLSREQLDQLLEYVRGAFARRFCKALRKAYRQGELQLSGAPQLEHLQFPDAFERWIAPLENRSWIVRCGESWDRTKMDQAPEATEKIAQYLANYVGRVALSDSRILDIAGDRVLFKYKDYRDGNQQKAQWIEGVELIHRFLQHLLPRGLRHIRYYGWMGPRAKQEKRDYVRQVHGVTDAQGQESPVPEGPPEAAPLEQEVRTRTCRFCDGSIRLTGRTDRPRVYELMEMPLASLRDAQAGLRVTLGDKLPPLKAERSGDPSAPGMRQRAQEIRRQLAALTTSSYL